MDSVSHPLQKPLPPQPVTDAGRPKAGKASRLTFGSRTFKTISSGLTTRQMIDSLSKADSALRERVICSSNPLELSHHLQALWPADEASEQTQDIDSLQVMEALNNLRLVDAYHRYVDLGEDDSAAVLRESMNRAASLYFLKTMDEQGICELLGDEELMKRVIKRDFYQFMQACPTIGQDIASDNALSFVQLSEIKSQLKEWLSDVGFCPVRSQSRKALEQELGIPYEMLPEFDHEGFMAQRITELESAPELLVFLQWGETKRVSDRLMRQGKSKLARLLCSDLLSKAYLSEYFEHLGKDSRRLYARKETDSDVYRSQQQQLASKIRSKLISVVGKARQTAEKVPYKKESFSSLETCCYYLKVYYQESIESYLNSILQFFSLDNQVASNNSNFPA
ncbi:MAG: hypothetical protein ACR2PX_08300 [Endozoicomonas sp.]|uniref:hypothetical protein n=1 Tax=Endozoicomonas sp. TaxID=1892382 RepID=UPI003D9AF333